MAANHSDSYTGFALAQSRAHRETLAALPLPDALAQRFDAMAEESLAKQQRMEAADRLSFEEWRRWYLAVDQLRPRAARAQPKP